MIEIAIEACGMVSSVGLSAPAACAAIRCGLTHFSETRFMDSHGQWITGAQVPLETPWRGRAKLAHMAALAVREASAGLDEKEIRQTPLVLCLAEPERPGRFPDQDAHLLAEVQKRVGIQFHPQSMIIANGRVGGVRALEKVQAFLGSGLCRYCMVAGVDTYLTAKTLGAYEKEQRILTEKNSDGFIPGEAGAAALLTAARQSSHAPLAIQGLGFGQEKAYLGSGHPLRADGLVQAIKAALAMAGRDLGDLDYRLCDLSGEQYYFKEAALALTRVLRKRKEAFDIQHPAECIGETGAAIIPVLLAVASAAIRKGYSKGEGILCHCANDDGQRGALVLNAFHREGSS
ncbi:MAG: hypothetical protein WAU91_22465 [Desulfatitalea sp.]